VPGGRIETERREYTVKTKGKLASAELFNNIVVFEHAGRVVHLRDVALVEDGMAEERTVSSLNGRRGVALMIRRQSAKTRSPWSMRSRPSSPRSPNSSHRLRDDRSARSVALHS